MFILLHFSTFISFFDLFLCLNFVLPISPTTLYYFKCYPNWPQILREERQRRPKKKSSSRFILSLLLRHYSSMDLVKIAGFGCRLNY